MNDSFEPVFVVQYYGHKEFISGDDDVEDLFVELHKTFDTDMIFNHRPRAKAMLYIDIATEIRYIHFKNSVYTFNNNEYTLKLFGWGECNHVLVKKPTAAASLCGAIPIEEVNDSK